MIIKILKKNKNNINDLPICIIYLGEYNTIIKILNKLNYKFTEFLNLTNLNLKKIKYLSKRKCVDTCNSRLIFIFINKNSNLLYSLISIIDESINTSRYIICTDFQTKIIPALISRSIICKDVKKKITFNKLNLSVSKIFCKLKNKKITDNVIRNVFTQLSKLAIKHSISAVLKSLMKVIIINKQYHLSSIITKYANIMNQSPNYELFVLKSLILELSIKLNK